MQTPQLRDEVRSALDAFVATLIGAFRDDLRSVILYGSGAEGRLRPTSDVNLIVVVVRFEKSCADALREPFRFVKAAIGLEVLFVLESELADAAIEFAQKFAEARRRHVILYGTDPVEGLNIPREALVRQVRQVLLNLSLRLREMYVERSLREEQCALTVAGSTGPLRSAAATILELEGAGSKAPKEALAAIVGELHRDDFEALLPHLSEARERRTLPRGRGAEVLYLTGELARALADRAARL